MYIVEVVSLDENIPNGPNFFSGSDEEYRTMREARDAAEDWISKTDNPKNYKIKSRIIGCL